MSWLPFDESRSTAVVLQQFASAADMETGAQAFDAMDPRDTPGTRASVDMCELKLDLTLRTSATGEALQRFSKKGRVVLTAAAPVGVNVPCAVSFTRLACFRSFFPALVSLSLSTPVPAAAKLR